MIKKTALAAAALLAAFAVAYCLYGMRAAAVIRKLSGMRMAVALYSLENKRPPAAFENTLASGKLEAAPYLKLSRHSGSSAVRNVPAFEVKDTGGWAYVNDPKDRNYGLVFIDCSHADEKGRFWSEF